MRRYNLTLFISLLIFLSTLLLVAPSLHSQEQSTPTNTQKKKEPLSEWSKMWLEEVVPYIITPAEKELFINLPNEEERGKFIENFWKRRDPDPSTPENEFKTAYYRRIAIANKLFGYSGIPGWRTDRGRVFITLGPPNEVQHDYLPSGAGEISVAARETWSYWGLPNPNLPYNFELTFVDRYGTGNFVLETSIASHNNRSFPLDFQDIHKFFNEMEILTEAMRNPFEKEEKLRSLITTQVNYSFLPLRTDIFTRKGDSDQTQVIFLIYFSPSSLEKCLLDQQDVYSLTVMVQASNEFGQVVMEKTKEVNFYQKLSYENTQKNDEYPFIFPVELPPETYGFHLLVLDNFSGKVGTIHQSVALSDFTEGSLKISDVCLFVAQLHSEESVLIPYSQYQTRFSLEDEISLDFEIYNLELDQMTNQANFEVKLSFYDGDKRIGVPVSLKKSVQNETDTHFTFSFRLHNFPPGSYRLKIEVKDEISQAVCSKEVEFQVIK